MATSRSKSRINKSYFCLNKSSWACLSLCRLDRRSAATALPAWTAGRDLTAWSQRSRFGLSSSVCCCPRHSETHGQSAISAIEKKFPALQESIPGIVSIEWGTNNSPEGLNKDFTHCFIVTFTDEEARSNYLPHLNHQAFVDILKPLLDDVFVIDYNLWKI